MKQILTQKLSIYLVADFTSRPRSFVLSQTEKALYGGTTTVQYRDKSRASYEEKADRCRVLAALARKAGALFVVNDSLELAISCQADGVHLGTSDLSMALARQRAPKSLIIGGSANDPAQARELEEQGADYLGVGAIYEARSSKPDASPPIGCNMLKQVVDAVNLPVVAIGGISADNVSPVWSTGVFGVAVIRAILDDPDPENAVKALYRKKSGKKCNNNTPPDMIE